MNWEKSYCIRNDLGVCRC